jgi:alginate O-acetyltransferase complex protein AlgI
MLFNSIEFFLFFPFVFITYYLISPKYRWLFLLVASYYFYMSWKPEYAILIMASTVIDYFTGLGIGKSNNKKIRISLLLVSLCTNLGLLFTFKYFNFFIDSINSISELVPQGSTLGNVNLILPVGISFYTFQTLSYTIDIYKGNQQPERNFGKFALFVSFFPQLVAGPIERSVHLLPQFSRKVSFDYNQVVSGLRLILWGLFKKMVIADRLALIVNEVYGSHENYAGFQLILGTVFFAFQIYCDFSGYSDIAIGAARALGFDLMTNFRIPYSVFLKEYS